MKLAGAKGAILGQQPVRDVVVVVECKACKKPVLFAAFANHYEACQKMMAAAPAPPLRPAVVMEQPVVEADAEAPLPPPPPPPVVIRLAPTPPQLVMVKQSRTIDDTGDVEGDDGGEVGGLDAYARGSFRRKHISVLEIKKDDDSDSKVTIMVETGPPAVTSRAVRAGAAAAPLASRRWTRRNKLTGLSLSFKIRSDECEEDDDGYDERQAHQGGDPRQGWAYTSERKRQGSPRSTVEEPPPKTAAVAPQMKRKFPLPVPTDNTDFGGPNKRFLFGGLFGEDDL